MNIYDVDDSDDINRAQQKSEVALLHSYVVSYRLKIKVANLAATSMENLEQIFKLSLTSNIINSKIHAIYCGKGNTELQVSVQMGFH